MTHSVQSRFAGANGGFMMGGGGGNAPDITGSMKVSGITVGLARQLTVPDDYFSLSNSLSLMRYNLDNFGNLFGAFSTGSSNTVTLNTTLSRYSAGNNPMYPTYGSNIQLSGTFTPPLSVFGTALVSQEKLDSYRWIEYHKWMLDNFWYFSLYKDKLVLNARVHTGIMSNYSKNAPVGPFERFVLGGDGLMMGAFLLGTDIIGLRGYGNNKIVPNEAFTNGNRGGVAFTKYVMELRYPVSLNPQATIFLLTFLEAGNNWGSVKEFDPFQLKKSAGVGARIFLPAFGLLGIDWGYGFDTEPGQFKRSGGQFHFTLGQQLR